jgi:transcriptional regulator with XRE-family HTH domain
MTIGQTIKDARIRKGLTQEELAEKTDISIRTIQRIESDEVDPRSYTLSTLARVLDLNYEELVNNKLTPSEVNRQHDENVWLPLLHMSGLFVLLLPPLLIWMVKKNEVRNIRSHAIDVINFQLTMLIYLAAGGILSIFLIGIPIAIFFGFFSTVVIIINTIRVINHQPYRYPWTLKILKS